MICKYLVNPDEEDGYGALNIFRHTACPYYTYFTGISHRSRHDRMDSCAYTTSQSHVVHKAGKRTPLFFGMEHGWQGPASPGMSMLQRPTQS